MRRALAILTLISVLVSAGAVRASDPECGARCLYVALKGLDLPVADYATFRSQLGAPPAGGHSLAQLADAAQAAGAQTLGVQTSLEELARRRPPFTFLAHLKSEHFVLVTNFENHKVSIIDPPLARDIPEGTFQALWDGTGLLISPRPITLAVDTRSGMKTMVWVLCGLAGVAACGWLLSRRRSAGPGIGK